MESIDFAGNDYLGLARDPRPVEVLSRNAAEYGISPTSSRWALSWTDIPQRLEEELADFLGAEAACIMRAAYFVERLRRAQGPSGSAVPLAPIGAARACYTEEQMQRFESAVDSLSLGG